MLLANLDTYILGALFWIGVPAAIFAFVHAGTQRTDAFQAADKLTKPAWLGITGASSLVMLLCAYNNGGMLFWLIGLVAVLVYIVDVRPAVTEVQRGPRW